MERVGRPKVKIVGETDWRQDLRRWAARIVVFAAFVIVGFATAWFIVNVQTPALRHFVMGWT